MIGECFISIAHQDLKLSLIAYKKGLYPQCIFLLQQANEKFAKEILIRGNFFDTNELKKFSHNAVRPFIKFTKDEIESRKQTFNQAAINIRIKEEQIFSKEMIDAIKKYDNMIKECENQLNYQWSNISCKDLESIFNEFETLIRFKEKVKISINSIKNVPERLILMMPGFEKYFDKDSNFNNFFTNKESVKELQKTLNGLINFTLNGSSSFLINLNLNLILYPHVSESRYPTETSNQIFQYDQNNILIKNFTQIHKYSELAFNRYSREIKKLEGLNSFVKIANKQLT